MTTRVDARRASRRGRHLARSSTSSQTGPELSMQMTTSAPRGGVGRVMRRPRLPPGTAQPPSPAVRFQAETLNPACGQAAGHVPAHDAGADEADLFRLSCSRHPPDMLSFSRRVLLARTGSGFPSPDGAARRRGR